jgi:hypothetical protein
MHFMISLNFLTRASTISHSIAAIQSDASYGKGEFDAESLKPGNGGPKSGLAPASNRGMFDPPNPSDRTGVNAAAVRGGQGKTRARTHQLTSQASGRMERVA